MRRAYLVDAEGGIPLTPMIDMTLLLLIFFVLITRYLTPSLDVTLPQAASGVVDDRPAINLSIDQAGQLAVDGDPTTWDELPGRLAGSDPATLVRVAADKLASYDYVVRALDACAGARLSHIALEIEPQT